MEETMKEDTKIILVGGDDYSVVAFENHEMTVAQAYAKAKANGGKFDINSDDWYFEVEAFDFAEVDSKFVDFIKVEIEDYDMSKNTTFFVVEDES